MREPAARRLLELLRAQRLAESERDHHPRDTDEWEAASDRLEELNVRIWQLASSGAEPHERLSAGLHAAVESDPEEDLQFRRAVLACLRRAYHERSAVGLAARTVDRLESASSRIHDATGAMEAAQAWLRHEYPDATIKMEPTDAPDTIRVHAERDLHVA
jgi:hypothetical protein